MVSINMFCYKVFQFSILLLHLTDVNCQFTFSALSLQPPVSSVGSNATATCNVTYTGSTTFVLTWKINDVSVQLYQINDGQVPLQASPPASDYDTSPSTTTSIVNTGDTFPMNLEIRNVSLSLHQANITLSCPAPGCIKKVNLQIGVCQPSTASGVIATVSSSPCGFGCTVQYSCASGYTGNDITATCQEDATFDAIPICAITCSNSDLPCSNPRYCFNETGSTNAGSTVTTQCNTTYSGSVSAACGNDGNWTITPQSPCPALCPVSDITSSPGRCTTATGDILEGQSITVTCCNGYAGVSTMAVCTSDSSWSNLPTCTKIPVTCSLSNLSSISNNVLQSNNSTLSVNETKIISCAAEYSGSGATASCSDNGTLTLTDTNCTKTPTPADTTVMTTDESVTSTASTTSTIQNNSNGDPKGKSLSDGAIAGIVIGCLIVVAIIIVVLIAIFCAEICCCTFSILCLSWGTKEPDPEPDITIPELKKNTQPDGPNGEGVEP